ncbi:MAG: NAD(P)/FAD-dependent oxidoreductase, partial [Planctomycetaceae bacterium]
MMKLLIVGGVAGGASAAARARRLSEDAQIIVFERGPDVSFANCGLPYHIGGEIADREKLLVVKPELLRSRFKLDVRTMSSVELIDRDAKTVRVRDLVTGNEYEESYDKLLLATGAAPFRPAVSGIDLPDVFTLRSLQDTDRIKQRIDRGVDQAVLIGGGFINLELAENCVRRGVATTVVEKNRQMLLPFDEEMTTPIVQELARNGVTLLLEQSAASLEKSDEGMTVCLNRGERLSAQLVVFGAGVRPENKLAVDAGLSIGVRGGICVNDALQTSDPDI